MPAAISATAQFSWTLLLAGVTALLAGTVLLWAYYGTAVFFEMVRAGFVACF